MIIDIKGFPGLSQLNDTRWAFFNSSHNISPRVANGEGELTSYVKVANWFGHKVLTLLSLPANSIGVGVGIVGMAATACTIGTLKVAIFAFTLGNVKPAFPSGFVWFTNRTVHSLFHVFRNLGELVYDAAILGYDVGKLGYHFVHQVAEKLHLRPFFREVFRKLSDLFEFIGNEIVLPVCRFVARRLSMGLERAVEGERGFTFSLRGPAWLRPLNEMTSEHRIDWNFNDRSLSHIWKHYSFSFVNIPLNTLVAACSGVASLILASAFLSKAALYAATNIDIPLPTFAGQAIDVTCATAESACVDVATNIGDGFVLLYKTANALGINRAVTTALQVLRYIPEAAFS